MIDPPTTSALSPGYCEAYPALKLVSARAAAAGGLQRCEWHNERLERVATMDLIEWAETTLDVVVEWIDRGVRRTRREVFDLRRHMTPTRKLLPDALCPGCEEAKPVLYLKGGEWKCAGCHRLVPIARLLNTGEKLLVRARRLHAEVYGREPPVRGFRTWDQKRLQLMMLTPLLEKTGLRELREHLRPRVTASWLGDEHEAEGDDDLVALRYRGTASDEVPLVKPWFGQPGEPPRW